MRRRAAYTGLVVLLLAGAGAFWALRSPRHGVEAPAEEAPGPVENPLVASPLPWDSPEIANGDPDDVQEPAKRTPTLGLPGGDQTAFLHAKRPKTVPARTWRLQQEAEREIWERHLGPLLYPEGHPEAGTWRDNVTLEQAVEAQVGYIGERWYPGVDMEEPRLYVERRIPYARVREISQGWDSHSIESSRELYEKLMAEPEDPYAYPTKVFLTADPEDSRTTTRAEHLRGLLRKTERKNFPDDEP